MARNLSPSTEKRFSLVADVTFLKTPQGWLAVRETFPRFAGYGEDQEGAERDLDRVIAAFHRSLTRAAQRGTFAESDSHVVRA